MAGTGIMGRVRAYDSTPALVAPSALPALSRDACARYTGCDATAGMHDARRRLPRFRFSRASAGTQRGQKRRLQPGVGRLTDRKSVEEGKRVSVRVDLGGRSNLKKKKMRIHTNQNKE